MIFLKTTYFGVGEEDSLYTKIPVSVTTEKVFNEFVNSDESHRKYFIQVWFYREKILKKCNFSVPSRHTEVYFLWDLLWLEYTDSLQSQLSICKIVTKKTHEKVIIKFTTEKALKARSGSYPAFWRLGHEGCWEDMVSLSYKVKLCLKQSIKKIENTLFLLIYNYLRYYKS